MQKRFWRRAACPYDGQIAEQILGTGTTQVRLADLAAGGRQVVIVLTVRLFVCQQPDCPVRGFAGQVDGLTQRYARRRPPTGAPRRGSPPPRWCRGPDRDHGPITRYDRAAHD